MYFICIEIYSKSHSHKNMHKKRLTCLWGVRKVPMSEHEYSRQNIQSSLLLYFSKPKLNFLPRLLIFIFIIIYFFLLYFIFSYSRIDFFSCCEFAKCVFWMAKIRQNVLKSCTFVSYIYLFIYVPSTSFLLLDFLYILERCISPPGLSCRCRSCILFRPLVFF